MIKIKQVISTFFFILFILIIGSYFTIYRTLYSLIIINDSFLYEIVYGSNVYNVLNDLQKKKIIKNNFWIYFLLKIHPKLKDFKANVYCLKKNMNIIDMLLLFNKGREYQFSIKFIQGTSLRFWLQKINNAKYIKHTSKLKNLEKLKKKLNIKNNYPLEGWFYPDTYFYNSHITDIQLLKKIYLRMKNIVDVLWNNRNKNLPYTNRYQMVIIASIIEKETSNPLEKKKIASVLLNRLSKRMKLQVDSTIIYGIKYKLNYKLLYKNLKKKNKYNTYIIYGLPPSAITTPSITSLKAAAQPIKSNYVYFVADHNGNHIFNTNFLDHKLTIQILNILTKK
ncbi:endolytic transglycosylase MltG [Enterobacteriaceae endosymbiont of Donacia tomentosa]|uniref:endolytic transglycosylase MltG n=1 Tax=Enterobacteriaceae endosymbiont of Donacia tomentosa TaxID=2675787 RepID=UPI001449205A|nr:endolytic transglycosylase MltG [Enterobacteriaceae endosymbiont of Donacia tomentosa]QJC31540.1 endolytic transglycosylase MltG [Enterobacteriaceae endosymbiont of Donacia tomentosa]